MSAMRVRIKVKKNDKFKNPRYWVAMGTLAACAVAGPGHAQTQKPVSGASQNPQSQSTLPVMAFAINAGALEDVVREFERASGWKVGIPEAGMHALPSKGVNGSMPVARALRQ